MTSMQDLPRRRRVVVGVDTHKHLHVAVALDELGGRIEARSFAADRSGYEQLIDWANSLGHQVIFGVEGTGSYGAGLASAIRLARTTSGTASARGPLRPRGAWSEVGADSWCGAGCLQREERCRGLVPPVSATLGSAQTQNRTRGCGVPKYCAHLWSLKASRGKPFRLQIRKQPGQSLLGFRLPNWSCEFNSWYCSRPPTVASRLRVFYGRQPATG